MKQIKQIEPPAGLFERIILAIKREQELRKTKRLLFSFAGLLVVSLAAVPFSLALLVSRAESSGIIYFISTALSDLGIFLTIWQNFSLAILESLPITALLAFAISLGISVFTLRLFLYKKGLLLKYLKNYA